MPGKAVLCPLCWASEKPMDVKAVRRMRWAVGLVLVMVAIVTTVLMVARANSHDGMSAYVAAAERYQSAVFKIVNYDSTGEATSGGSGLLVDSTGLAVTAFHVLRGSADARVEFQGGRMFEALGVVAWDSVADIAVFKVGRKSEEGVMHPVANAYPELCRLAGLEVGAPVVAIGAPEGLSNTISDGIVSAIRNVNGEVRVQVTTPTSHGSSGGPVFDVKGRVFGIVKSGIEEGQNLNFIAVMDDVPAMLAETTLVSMPEFADRTLEVEEVETFEDKLFRLAREEHDEERFENAVKIYTQILESNPDNVAAHYEIAFCLKRLGKASQALMHINRFLALSHDEDRYRERALKLKEDLEILTGLKVK